MPKLIIIIDEFLILAKENNNVINSLIDITTRGRALGINLILATQNSSNSIPNTIKTNIDLQIYMYKNEYVNQNHFMQKQEKKIPGRAFIGNKEIQFLWTYTQDFISKLIKNIVEANSLQANTSPYPPIINPKLPERILSTANQILYTPNNEILYPKTTNFSDTSFIKNTEILIGISQYSNMQGNHLYYIQKESHNFQIPSYNIKTYIETLIFILLRHDLTIVVVDNINSYKNIYAEYKSNIILLDYLSSSYCVSVIQKYINSNKTFNLLIENWENFIDMLSQNIFSSQSLFIQKLFKKSQQKEIFLIAFSQKPIKNFENYYHFNNNEILWKNANIKTTHNDCVKGRVTTYTQKSSVQIQLLELKDCSLSIVNSLESSKLNQQKYILKLPKLFLYNYENYSLINKTSNIDKNTFVLGIQELDNKIIKAEYQKNYIVYTNSIIEKENFIKTFFKIPRSENINDFFKTNDIKLNSILNNTIKADFNFYSEEILIAEKQNKKFLLANLEKTIGIENIIMTQYSHNIPTILFVNTNNYTSKQNPIYRTFISNSVKILFQATQKTLELFDLYKKNQQIIFNPDINNDEILLIENNTHKWLKLAQIT